uniref:Integrase catalytic domain-containing protein n=1 Tax=Amphiprion ocellaris TaxID=80972 RepID=A0AAQ5Y7J2_AMPOC
MDIVSDRGPQFTSQVWKAFCSALGATVSLTSGFHPQSNGQTERLNQEMEAALRCIASENPSAWSAQIPWVEYAHNTLPNASSGLSPFHCVHGYQPPLFPELEEEIALPSVAAHLRGCARTWRQARAALLRASRKTQDQANRHRSAAPVYSAGQRVWLRAKDLPLRVEAKKLAPRFVGPFEVEAIINPCAVRLKLPRSMRVHPTFHVSQLKPVRESPLVSPVPTPPPPRTLDDHPIYTAVAGACSTWWTGRVMDRRNGAGFPVNKFWTQAS